MSKLIHVIKKGLSYKQSLNVIELLLDDKWKDHLEIRIEKAFSEMELKMYCDLVISYFKKEDSIEVKSG